MNILFITNMFPSKDHPQFGIFVENQVKALTNQGQKVLVLGINQPSSSKKKVINKYFQWGYRWGRMVLSSLKPKVDIVHAHYTFPSGMLALMFKKLTKTPYVVTCHGGDINKMAEKNKYLKRITSIILKKADHVIVVGPELREKVQNEYEIPSHKINQISMGVNKAMFHPVPKEEALRVTQLNSDEKNILFVGNLVEEKGIEDLLKAWKTIVAKENNIKLHVVGSAKSEAYKSKITDLIHTENMEASVSFHGARPQPELKNWFSSADMLVVPSRNEGFGLVALEAMACKTPVVTTDAGGLKYITAEGRGLMANAGNPGSLSEKISAMLNFKEDEKEAMIKEALIFVEENEVNNLNKKVLNIYKEVINYYN